MSINRGVDDKMPVEYEVYMQDYLLMAEQYVPVSRTQTFFQPHPAPNLYVEDLVSV